MSIQARNLEVLQHFPLHPVASESGTFTGATTNIADLGQLEGDVQIILDAGAAAASGTMTGKIQHSDTTTSGDFSNLTGATFTAVAQAASKQVLTVSDVDRKRYIRFVGTIAASGTTTYSVSGYGVKKYM
jgi:hypothetical protein